jgi:hypothetical protein
VIVTRPPESTATVTASASSWLIARSASRVAVLLRAPGVRRDGVPERPDATEHRLLGVQVRRGALGLDQRTPETVALGDGGDRLLPELRREPLERLSREVAGQVVPLDSRRLSLELR